MQLVSGFEDDRIFRYKLNKVQSFIFRDKPKKAVTGELSRVGRRGLAHVNISTDKKVPGTRCQLITYFHASNFKLPDS